MQVSLDVSCWLHDADSECILASLLCVCVCVHALSAIWWVVLQEHFFYCFVQIFHGRSLGGGVFPAPLHHFIPLQHEGIGEEDRGRSGNYDAPLPTPIPHLPYPHPPVSLLPHMGCGLSIGC